MITFQKKWAEKKTVYNAILNCSDKIGFRRCGLTFCLIRSFIQSNENTVFCRNSILETIYRVITDFF